MIRNLPPSKMSSSHFLKLSLYFFLVFKTQTLVTSSLNSVVVFDIVHLSKFPVPRVWPKSIICANLLWASRQSAANSNPHPAPKPIYIFIFMQNKVIHAFRIYFCAFQWSRLCECSTSQHSNTFCSQADETRTTNNTAFFRGFLGFVFVISCPLVLMFPPREQSWLHAQRKC